MDIQLKLALIRRNLTLADVAAAVNRSQTLISLILNGKRGGWAHRAKIRALLGVDKKALPDKPPARSKRSRNRTPGSSK
jgi:transcriptional regulator with XRE-family HTH domain